MVTLGCSFLYPAITAATWEAPGAPVHVHRFRVTAPPLLPVPFADGVEELEEHAARAPAPPANRAETAASRNASRLLTFMDPPLGSQWANWSGQIARGIEVVGAVRGSTWRLSAGLARPLPVGALS